MISIINPLIYSFIFILIIFLGIKIFLKKQYPQLYNIVMTCFFLHICLLAVIQYVCYVYPDPRHTIFASDGHYYSMHARIISAILKSRPLNYISSLEAVNPWVSEYTTRGMIPPARTYQVGYITYFYGILYSIFGNYSFVLNLWNIVLHLLSGILVYKISIFLFDRRSAFLTILLFLFNPTMFYYSTTKVAESSYIFLVCLIIYLCITVKVRSFSILNFAKESILTTTSFFSSLFKRRPLGPRIKMISPGLARVAMVVTALFLFHLLKGRLLSLLLMAIFLYAATVVFIRLNRKLKISLFLAVFLCLLLCLPKLLVFFNTLFNTLAYTHRMSYLSGGQVYNLMKFGPDYTNYTILEKLAYFFFGWLHFIIEPTQYSSILYILYYPFKITFIALFILAIAGMFISIKEKKRPALLLIIYMLFMGTIIANASGNAGTMLRHRDAITFVVFIFAGFCMSRLINLFRREKAKNNIDIVAEKSKDPRVN